MSRPTVCYCCFDVIPAPKGAGTHVHYFVEALAAHYDVTLVSIGTQAADGEYAGARHRVIPLRAGNYLDRTLAYREALWALCDETPFDVIHFRTMWAAEPAAAAPVRVVEVNALESLELPYHYPALCVAPALLAKLRAQEDTALAAATAIVTPSSVTARLLLARGAPAERVHVIPNGVDLTRFTPAERPPATPPRLLYVGTLAPWQGVDVLVEALHRLLPDVPVQVEILAPESRKWRAALVRRLRKRGLEPWVTLRPPVPHAAVAEVIGAADICVAPLTATARNTVQGCSPLKVLEYLACGKAVIASDLPVVRDICTPDVDALLVPAGKATPLAEAIRRLAADPALRHRLGTAAATTARIRFGWPRAQEALLGVYTEALAGLYAVGSVGG